MIELCKFHFNLDIRICLSNLKDSNCSGLVYYLQEVYYIHVEKTEDKARQFFTICHEIGHILRNWQLKYEFCTDYNRKELERFCDRFAAAFLMSKNLFIQLWNSTVFEFTDMKIAHLANRFQVSIQASCNRARDFGLI